MAKLKAEKLADWNKYLAEKAEAISQKQKEDSGQKVDAKPKKPKEKKINVDIDFMIAETKKLAALFPKSK